MSVRPLAATTAVTQRYDTVDVTTRHRNSFLVTTLLVDLPDIDSLREIASSARPGPTCSPPTTTTRATTSATPAGPTTRR